MKTYLTPSLAGVLSDDYLYFEGISRPQVFFALRDGREVGEDERAGSILVLEQYFNDLYNLFLRKLTGFASGAPTSEEDAVKLQALLQELIKIKSLIENAGKVAIMGT